MVKIRPAFLPLLLVACLALAAFSVLIKPLGPASLILTVLVVATARLLAPWVAGWSHRRLAWVVALVLVAALCGQLAVRHALPDTIYHDPFRVLAQADRLAAGLSGFGSTYFWRYPNNVPLAFLLAQ
ncbi:hypothetical protein [Lacticaseibacillus parakribbianus]|uniref:hypothetical protein n=1 Tax=Lacticaseibacillus parakribbianus TaxID=2970927 RepID=UPI0021CB3BB9|nr:hypothetical protein [Lacticaseibacillus parakribbianus]